MKTEGDHRKELIRRQLTMISNGEISAAIQTWRTFAVQLMSIIGEEGFLVLYSRSLHLLHAAFPMLPNGDSELTSASWLADLEIALAGLDLIEANSANKQLLMTFTNILASLIGEDLTIEILRSSWGNTATNRKPESKEINDGN